MKYMLIGMLLMALAVPSFGQQSEFEEPQRADDEWWEGGSPSIWDREPYWPSDAREHPAVQETRPMQERDWGMRDADRDFFEGRSHDEDRAVTDILAPESWDDRSSVRVETREYERPTSRFDDDALESSPERYRSGSAESFEEERRLGPAERDAFDSWYLEDEGQQRFYDSLRL